MFKYLEKYKGKISKSRVSRLYIVLCDLLHPVCRIIANQMKGVDIVQFKLEYPLPECKPIIFVANHSNMHDAPVLMTILKRHIYILAGDEPRRDFNGLALAANGVIWIKRDRRESRNTAKEMLLDLLKLKKNILLFPEATWNLTECLPMNHLHWGVIELAELTGAPIVPITLEYTEKERCYFSIGKPIYISKQCDKEKEITKLRDVLATMRWNYWESVSHIKRDALRKQDFLIYTEARIEEYGKLDVAFEKRTLLKRGEAYEEVFAHLEKVQPTRNNIFLFNKKYK